MPLEFEDNRLKVKEALFDAGEAFLHEACGELQAKTQRNSRVDTGQTKGSYEYNISGSFMAGEQYGQVGSNLENAIWEEFGTGEYALHGDGRKGGWYIPEEKLTAKAKSKMQRRVGKNGKVFYFTKGKTPNRPMYNAFTALKNKLIKRYADILRSKIGG